MDDICLVTGGAGFIGCAVCDQLVAKFETVVVVDNLHPQIHADQSGGGRLHRDVKFLKADIVEETTWQTVFDRYHPKVIIHLAAETGTGQSLLEASRHSQVNVLGLSRMLDAAASMRRLPARIVLASSRAVYGEGAWCDLATGTISYPGQRSIAMLEARQWDYEGLVALPVLARETRCDPTSVYASTKLAQEHILRSWCTALEVEAYSPRLQNVYGPGQSLTNSYTGIVPLFARIAKSGLSIPVYEDGDITRDFVFIEDVAHALVTIACGQDIPPGTYDIGSGVATSILHLATLIAKRYGAPPPTISSQYRPGDVRHARCDIERTVATLGWTPKVSLDEGLDALCRWMDGMI